MGFGPAGTGAPSKDSTGTTRGAQWFPRLGWRSVADPETHPLEERAQRKIKNPPQKKPAAVPARIEDNDTKAGSAPATGREPSLPETRPPGSTWPSTSSCVAHEGQRYLGSSLGSSSHSFSSGPLKGWGGTKMSRSPPMGGAKGRGGCLVLPPF